MTTRGGPPPAATGPTSPPIVFLRFLRFGFLAWGGPIAQVAMLRRELVDEEGWLPDSRFLRLLAIYQLLPGPEAHELSVHLGMLRAGRLAGFLAGLGFMLPGFLLMLALSWLYARIDLGQVVIAGALLGAQIGVIALILRGAQQIGRRALTDAALFVIALAAAALSLVDVAFWVILPAGAVAYVVGLRVGTAWRLLGAIAIAGAAVVVGIIGLSSAAPEITSAGVTSSATPPTLPGLFASGLKAGLLTFGGAYTVIPFLRDDAVGSGWMTDATFLDGVALSGVLPAPLIIFSTFVGYVAGGVAGATAMTIGIFLPAFAFSLLLGDRLEAIIRIQALHAALAGVTAAVIGLIAATTIELGSAAVMRVPNLLAAVFIFIGALAALAAWRSRAGVPLTIAMSAAAGALLLR